MKTKKLILCMIFACISTIVLTCSASFAALQSNPTTHASNKTDTPTNWIKAFRNIETSSGGLGYTETIDNTTLAPTSDANGIDIHMMKSTEYGLVAILTVSGYGNPTTSGTMTTSTGNNTGVMFNQNNNEFVAGGLEGNAFSGVAVRYYDAYTSERSSAKRGDALGTSGTTNPGCSGWRGGANAWWIEVGWNYFPRGGSNGLFGFDASNQGNAYSRGVAVVGSNIE